VLLERDPDGAHQFAESAVAGADAVGAVGVVAEVHELLDAARYHPRS
jgi:hypothetical protein